MMAGDFDPEVVSMAQRFAAYFVDLVHRHHGEALGRGECPAGSFSNTIFETCPTGYEPTFDEQVRYETLLATGGNETTAQLLSNLVILLAEQPRDPRDGCGWSRTCVRRRWRRCSATSRRSPACSGTPPGPCRSAGAHREIPTGAKVLLMYGSGNHDEAHYDRADEFVIDRYPRRLR